MAIKLSEYTEQFIEQAEIMADCLLQIDKIIGNPRGEKQQQIKRLIAVAIERIELRNKESH